MPLFVDWLKLAAVLNTAGEMEMQRIPNRKDRLK